MHEPMNDELMHDLAAVARLEARRSDSDASPEAPEDRWTRPARDRQRRDRLIEGFLAGAPADAPAHRRPGRIVALASTAFAAAASLLLAWRLTSPPEVTSVTTPSDPLGYTLAIEGGVVSQRGAPTAGPATFAAGDSIRLRLIPPTPMRPTLVVHVHAVQADHHIKLDWPWRIDPLEGVIEVDGQADDLRRVAPGTWTLSVSLRDDVPPHQPRDRLLALLEIAP